MSYTPDEFDLMVAQKLMRKAENAKRRGIEFTLTFQAMKNLMKSKKCYYTGLKLTYPRGGNLDLRPTDATIDRIDSSLGYILGNVVMCSHAANQMKAQFESFGLTGLKAGRNVFDKAIRRIESNKIECNNKGKKK